ncbi:MAG: hypothetical protein RRY34_04215 [Victivallaceae bacterium]
MGRKDFISNSLYGMRDHIKTMQQQMAENKQEKSSALSNEEPAAAVTSSGAPTENGTAAADFAGFESIPNPETVNICVPPPQITPDIVVSPDEAKKSSPELKTPEKSDPAVREPEVKVTGNGNNMLPEKRREEIFRLHQDLKVKVTRQLAEAEFSVSNYNEAINSLQNYSGFLGKTLRGLEKFNCPEEYDLLTFKELENLRLEFICRNVEADRIRANCSESGNVVDCTNRGNAFDLKSLPGSLILKFGFLAALPLIVVLLVCCIVLALVQLAAFGIIK